MTDNKPKYVGDEFVEEEEEGIVSEEEEVEGLYDLVLPPGVPHKVIIEAADKFNLEVTKRECALKTIDVERERLLVLRGERDILYKAQDYIYQNLCEMYNYKK